MRNKDWEKELFKETVKHFKGLLVTDFGKDKSKIAFLQAEKVLAEQLRD
jgi:hypothetical protein